jgi:hypothetical protein
MAKQTIDGITADFQNGGWYGGRQYWDGKLGAAGTIINPEQVGAGQKVSSEVNKQSDAAQGLAPGTIDKYVATQPQVTSTAKGVTPAPTSNYNGGSVGNEANGGAGAGMGTATQKPAIDLTKVYSDAFNTPEINSLNTALTAKKAEIDKANSELATAMAQENDNPWYSEAARTGKLSKLQTAAQNKIQALTGEYNSALANLTAKKADAQTKVDIALKQYDINSQAYQQNLSNFNALLGMGAMNNADAGTIASYANTLGLTTGQVQSIVDKSKKDGIKTSLINSTDNAGNMTIAAVNAETGEIISQTKLTGVGKAETTGGGSSSNKNINTLRSDVQGGAQLKDIIAKYVGILPQATIMSIYNSLSPYDAAKETPQQINEMFGGTKAVPMSQLPANAQANIKQARDMISSGMTTREQIIQQAPDLAPYL